jgi:hypothetical protein
MIDITVIVPSIRPQGLQRLFPTIFESAGKYTVQVIVIGPNQTESDYEHFEFINDLGSPSRCLQRAATHAKGTLLTWGTDDGTYFKGALEKCADKLLSSPESDGIVVKYTEEGPYSDLNGSVDDYYVAWNHRDNQLPGIPKHYVNAPVPMYYTKTFKELGGLDCSFEHINMNTHDLAYRIQNAGGTLHFSEDVVLHCNSNNFGPDHVVLDQSYTSNDLPKFRALYDNDGPVRQTIDIDNWKDSPEVWRRFK